jgi:DNA-binding HxlR family transcriptional regulator
MISLPLTLRDDLRTKLKNGDFNCEKELTLSIISGKWKVVIIYHLGHDGMYRYGELHRLFNNNISNRILTKQLRELEQDGIISRNVCTESTLRVEYNITELGMTLLPIVDALYKWGKEHMSYYVERL